MILNDNKHIKYMIQDNIATNIKEDHFCVTEILQYLR